MLQENSSSDVADSKSPFCPREDDLKVPFLLPKYAPKGSKTLSPAVVDLAGKKSPVALSVSRLDSDTLSDNPFCGPREIPRFLNGVFVGQFLPQVQIPADHPRGDDIRRVAAILRALPAYLTRGDYIEHRIWTLMTMDVSKVTHHAEAIAKCPTIRLGVSDECFTYCNPGTNMNECPSFRCGEGQT